MSVERFYNPLVRRLAALPKPVICAVNGVAAGGRYPALGCDIVLAAFGQIVMAFSKLGSVPDCGGSWFLPRVAGRARWGWRCWATASARNRPRSGDYLATGG